MNEQLSNLFKKYDVPAPRYTSYPTVPYWEQSPTTTQWFEELKKAFSSEVVPWALYMHIPFCESLCTFCGCNTSITRDHKKELPYIDLLTKEFESYIQNVPEFLQHPLEELHLGGGTPTFISPENLIKLLAPILERVKRSARFEASIEVDPRRTTTEHLKALKSLGFTRVSMGVQDFNSETQRLVNRIQPFEITRDLTQSARELGFASVNFDLIYGLPKQSLETMSEAIEKTLELRPDRIALYSYAHVPWIKPAQRLFTEKDLPQGEEKRQLYEYARARLLEEGYLEIGMDHFALPTDSLSEADKHGQLHRNFMGYTSRRTKILLGLGVSAISEAPTCFHQNEKVLPVYERRVNSNEVPTFRGHLLNDEDQSTREQILELMTKWHTKISNDQVSDLQAILAPLIQDNLVELNDTQLKMTAHGKPFLRNACMALDRRLRRQAPQTKLFSQSV